jgi:hypothetical protein
VARALGPIASAYQVPGRHCLSFSKRGDGGCTGQ